MTIQRQPTNSGLPLAVKPKPDDALARKQRSARSLLGTLLVVIAGAVAATALGAGLHAQTLDGFPLGALAALVLSGSVAVFVGAWSRSVWPTAAVAVLTYSMTGLLATSGGPSTLIVTGSTGLQTLPVAVAGNLWIFGQAVVGILAVVVVTLVLRTYRKTGDRKAVPGSAG